MSNKEDKKAETISTIASNCGANDEVKSNQISGENLLDLERLKLSQNFHETVGVKKTLLKVPIRKPSRQEFIRTHPEEQYRLETAVIELKEERETYLVNPDLWSAVPGEIVPKVLITTINRQGVLSLWPIRLPGPDGRHDTWNQVALEAARIATLNWIRIAANMSLGAYDIYEASDGIPDPEWPDISFQKILEIAFKDNFINDLNHPVLKQLRGEV